MGRGLVLVEGHGEVDAVGNLVNRMWRHLGLNRAMQWWVPRRWKNLTNRDGIIKACEHARVAGPDVFLIIRDSDQKNACPATDAPTAAGWMSDQRLPFPSAIVLAHQEFETWFMASMQSMAGHAAQTGAPGIRGGIQPHPQPELVRGVKEWISRNSERPYKPTLHQLKLTRLVDCDQLLESGTIPVGQPGCISSGGSLGRALTFLNANIGESAVYPARR